MTVVALVLAAGSSRRMGQPKALLPIGDETFLARIVRILREGGADTVAVVVGGDHRPEIEAAARALSPEVTLVANDDPGDGPVSSVRRGVEAHRAATGFLIQPVDVPGIEAADVRALLGAVGDDSRGRVDAFVPSVDMRRGHPLFLRARAARRLIEGEGAKLASVRALLALEDLELAYVVRENRGLLRDYDTPADLAREANEARPPNDQSG